MQGINEKIIYFNKLLVRYTGLGKGIRIIAENVIHSHCAYAKPVDKFGGGFIHRLCVKLG